MGSFSPWTVEGGSNSSGPLPPLRGMHRAGAFELRSPEAARRPRSPTSVASMRSVTCSAPSCSAVPAQRMSSGRSSVRTTMPASPLSSPRPCVDRISRALFEWCSPRAGQFIGGIESCRRRPCGPAPLGECPGGGLLPSHPSAPVAGGGDADRSTPVRRGHRPPPPPPPPGMRLRTPLDTRISGRNVLRLDW